MSRKPSKDFVKIATFKCPMCGVIHSRDAHILLNKRMAEIKETLCGFRLCEEHYQEDYIAVLPVNPDTQEIGGDSAFVRKEAFHKVFTNVEISEDTDFVFCDPEVIHILKIQGGHNE